MCAEMFLGVLLRLEKGVCFLCVCRDVSMTELAVCAIGSFSLRVQRCFRIELGSVAD